MSAQPNFTTEQLLSLRTDRNISVTANAGSGKTMVLVERFSKIILENIVNSRSSLSRPLRIDPSRILAITFTRKAAAEMQKKIISRFDDEYTSLINSDRQDIRKLETFKRIREGLSYSNISTIHSFCSSILRNFPVEANVPVNFFELTEAENLHLIEECFLSTIEDWLNANQSATSGQAQKITNLLNYFTRKDLQFIATSVINKAEIHSAMEMFYSKSNHEIKYEAISFILKSFSSEETIDLLNRVIDTFNNYSSFIKNNDKATEIIRCCQSITKIDSDSTDFDGLFSFLSSVNQVLVLLLTKSGTVNKILRKNLDVQAQLVSDEIDDNYSNINGLLEAFESFDYFDEAMVTSRYLWEFISDVYKMMADEKYNSNRLDFNDLQLKAYEVLLNPEVAEKVRKMFDFVMIDEFQDTNDLQYSIVKAIMPELEDISSESGINLFIVGDAKQSIYGFRNADVRVFNKAIENILELNRSRIDAGVIDKTGFHSESTERAISEQEFQGKNKLTSTFRLLPIPAAFINIIFRNLMSVKQSDYDVDYEDLVCSRNIDKLDFHDNAILPSAENGEIVFILSESAVKESSEHEDEDVETEVTKDEYPEEKQIAKYIKSLIGRPLHSSAVSKKIEFGDIAILSHKKTNFSKLAKILLEEDIPYIINGGYGFYSTEEVRDIIVFLQFLYNPNDDISFTALLRSPFLNFDDTEIYKIRFSSFQGSLWEKFVLNAKNVSWEKLNNAYTNLNALRNYSTSQSISVVIYKILDMFGWTGKMTQSNSLQQKLANVAKLIDMAREFENLGFRNIIDFIEEINFISDNTLREGEAPVITDDNAVNILTIHAAKGLQFPVVVLYNTNSGTGNVRKNDITKEFGIGFRLNIPNDTAFINNVRTPFDIINSMIIKQMEEAEAKRVLYVGLTRAEEILAISGLVTPKKEGGFKAPVAYLDLIMKGLNTSVENILENGFKMTTVLPVRRNNLIESYSIEVESGRMIEQPANIDYSPQSISVDNYIDLTGEVRSVQINEVFSASKIMTFNRNKEEYLLHYLLGFPQDDEMKQDTTDTNDIITGAYPGKIIHSVMEKLNDWIDVNGVVQQDMLRNIICSVTGTQNYDESNPLHSRVYFECSAISRTALFQEKFKFFQSAEFEKQLSIPVGENFLSGIIDVLFIDNNGNANIWDWKTNMLDSIKDAEPVAETYKIQMKIYSYLISRLYPEQDRFTARLLFSRLAGISKSDDEWTVCFSWSKPELDAFGPEFESLIENIRNKLYFWL